MDQTCQWFVGFGVAMLLVYVSMQEYKKKRHPQASVKFLTIALPGLAMLMEGIALWEEIVVHKRGPVPEYYGLYIGVMIFLIVLCLAFCGSELLLYFADKEEQKELRQDFEDEED